MKIRWFWVLFVFLLCGMSGLSAQEQAPQPPDDPARRAQIERWVSDLGASEFQAREKAFANLLEAGEEAAYALIPVAESSEDLEVSERVGKLLEKIAWVPSPVLGEIRGFIDVLRSTRDAGEWNGALEKLKTLGSRARIEFEKIRRTPQGEVGISVEPKQSVLKRGEPVSCRVELKNTGETPVWLATSQIRILPLPTPFCRLVRDEDPFRKGAEGYGVRLQVVDGEVKMFSSRTPGPETPPYVYLEPGESFSYEAFFEGEEVDWIGTVEILGTYEKPGGRRRDADAWPAIEPFSEALRTKAVVTMVPPRVPDGQQPVHKGLVLFLSLPDTEENPVERRGADVILTWTNRSKTAITVKAWDRGEREGLWYALFDGEGKFLSAGGIGTPSEPDAEREWTTLQPGQSLSVRETLPIPPEIPAKDLQVVVGCVEFARHLPPGVKVNFKIFRPSQDGNMEDILQEKAAWKGILHSNVLEIDPSGE